MTPTGLRDPAEYTEASYEPELPADSLEDRLLEILEGKHSVTVIVTKIVEIIQTENPPEPVSTRVDIQSRARILEHFLEQFSPNEWTLVNWWAIQFAAHTKATENMTLRTVCHLLHVKPPIFCYFVKKWRKQLRLPKNRDLHREGCRVAGRRRRALALKT